MLSPLLRLLDGFPHSFQLRGFRYGLVPRRFHFFPLLAVEQTHRRGAERRGRHDDAGLGQREARRREQRRVGARDGGRDRGRGLVRVSLDGDGGLLRGDEAPLADPREPSSRRLERMGCPEQSGRDGNHARRVHCACSSRSVHSEIWIRGEPSSCEFALRVRSEGPGGRFALSFAES